MASQKANVSGAYQMRNPYLGTTAPGVIAAELKMKQRDMMIRGLLQAASTAVSIYSTIQNVGLQKDITAARVQQSRAATENLKAQTAKIESEFRSSYNTYLETTDNPVDYTTYRSSFTVQGDTTIGLNANNTSLNQTGKDNTFIGNPAFENQSYSEYKAQGGTQSKDWFLSQGGGTRLGNEFRSTYKGAKVPVFNVPEKAPTSGTVANTPAVESPQFFTPQDSQVITEANVNYQAYGKTHEAKLLELTKDKHLSQDTNPTAYGVTKSLQQGHKGYTVYKGKTPYVRYEYTDFVLDDNGNRVLVDGSTTDYQMETKYIDIKKSLFTQNAKNSDIFGVIKPPMTEQNLLNPLITGDSEFKKNYNGPLTLTDNNIKKIKKLVRTQLIGDSNKGNLIEFTKNFKTIYEIDNDNFSFDTNGDGTTTATELTDVFVRYSNLGKKTPLEYKKWEQGVFARAEAYGKEVLNRLTPNNGEGFNVNNASALISGQLNEFIDNQDVKGLSELGLGDASFATITEGEGDNATARNVIQFSSQKTIDVKGLNSVKAVMDKYPNLTKEQAQQAYQSEGKYSSFTNYDPNNLSDMEKLETRIAENIYTGKDLQAVKENIIQRYNFEDRVDTALTKIDSNESLSDNYFLKSFNVDSVSELPPRVKMALINKKIDNNTIKSRSEYLEMMGIDNELSIPPEHFKYYYQTLTNDTQTTASVVQLDSIIDSIIT